MADIAALWAKSNSSGGYPLPRHLLDAGAVAWELSARLPSAAWVRLGGAIGIDETQARIFGSFVAAAHDLGKASPGFQSKWEPGRARAQAAGFTFGRFASDRHDAATAAILEHWFRQRGWPGHIGRLAARAAAAHHGFAVPAMATHYAEDDIEASDASWDEAHDQLIGMLLEHVGEPAKPVNATAATGPAIEWLSGFVAVTDWIASSVEFFPHDRSEPFPTHWRDALGLARTALDEIGWRELPFEVESRGGKSMGLVLAGRAPRPLQTAAVQVSHGISTPCLVIVEAPMGEGKTEAALWLASKGVAESQRGFYVAMPTQATANGLFLRARRFVDAFGGEDGLVALAHGGSAGARRRLIPFDIDHGRGDPDAGAWFTDRRRSLLAPTAVGTIDQALVGVLNAKHRFVRLFGLADRVIVLDEVHAYDTYTSTLLERLVGWLGALGCSVVIMSATLPAMRRRQLARAWLGREAPPEIQNSAYPRIVAFERRKTGSAMTSFAATRRLEVRVERMGAEVDELAHRARMLAARGGCILVLCNTVRRAQLVYTRLRDCAVPVLLFHARFPAEDRGSREAHVVSAFGPNGMRPDAMIVVATQVVEQSLDVDFDALITDIAPVDLILQRIGRMHRHERASRPHSTPTVHIAGLERAEPSRTVAGIYDTEVVLRSMALLIDRPSITLPDDIDPLVQTAYAETFEFPDWLQDAGAAAHAEAAAERARDHGLAENAALPGPDDWAAAQATVTLDQDAAELRTRLGERTLGAIPLVRENGTIRVFPDGPAWSEEAAIPTALQGPIANRMIKTSHRGLVAALPRAVRPIGWTSSSYLAGLYPLWVDVQGSTEAFPDSVWVDAELGLVYGKREEFA